MYLTAGSYIYFNQYDQGDYITLFLEYSNTSFNNNINKFQFADSLIYALIFICLISHKYSWFTIKMFQFYDIWWNTIPLKYLENQYMMKVKEKLVSLKQTISTYAVVHDNYLSYKSRSHNYMKHWSNVSLLMTTTILPTFCFCDGQLFHFSLSFVFKIPICSLYKTTMIIISSIQFFMIILLLKPIINLVYFLESVCIFFVRNYGVFYLVAKIPMLRIRAFRRRWFLALFLALFLLYVLYNSVGKVTAFAKSR